MESTTEGKQYQVSKTSGIFLVIVLALLQASDWADRSILAISLQAIKDTFKMSDTQAGLLPSLLLIGLAIMTVPTAMLADRVSRRKVVMTMSLVWSVFTLTTGVAQQMWHLLVSRFMVGAGEAGYQPAGQTWMGVSFRKEIRSRIMALFLMFQPLGTALGLFVGGALLTATGNWRTSFFVFGFVGIALAFTVLFLPDYKTVKKPGEATFSKAYFKGWGELFKIKSYIFYVVGSTFMYFIAFAGPSWMPTLLMRTYNVEAVTAGSIIAGVSLLALLAPLAGILADRWQKRSPIGRPLFTIVTIVVFLCTYLAAAFTIGTMPLNQWVIIYSLTSLSSAFLLPALIALPHDFVPIGIRSTAIGIQTLIAQMLGGMLGPVFVGYISDRLGGGAHGIQYGLIYAVPIAAISVIFILILLKYYKSDCSRSSDAVMAEK